MPIIKFYDLTTETDPKPVSYFIQEGKKKQVFRAVPVDKLGGISTEKLLTLRDQKDKKRAKSGIPQPEDVVSTGEVVTSNKPTKKQKKAGKKGDIQELKPEKVGSTGNVLQPDVEFVDERGNPLRTNLPTKSTGDVDFLDEAGHPIYLGKRPNQETSSLPQDIPIKKDSSDEEQVTDSTATTLKGQDTSETNSCTGCFKCGISTCVGLNKKRAKFEVNPEPDEGYLRSKCDTSVTLKNTPNKKRAKVEKESESKEEVLNNLPNYSGPGEEFCRLKFDGEEIFTGAAYNTLGVHTENLGNQVTPNHFGYLLDVEERTGFYARPPHNIDTGDRVCIICLHDHTSRLLNKFCPHCNTSFHSDCWDSWVNGKNLANNCCPWCQEFVVWDKLVSEGIDPTSTLACTKQYWDQTRFNYQLLRHIPFVYEKLSAEGTFVLPIKFTREFRGYDLLQEVNIEDLDIAHFGA